MKGANSFKTLLLLAALFGFLGLSHGQDKASDSLIGTWTKTLDNRILTFTISSDQSYTVEFIGDEGIDVYGSYVISATQITFKDKGGDYSADVPGVYEFTLKDNSLTFTPVDDPVYGRSLLVEGTWSKAKKTD